MDVPGRQPGPANHLPGEDPLSGSHSRIDVPVAKMAEVNVTANAGRGRLLDHASLDRVDPMRTPAGGATLAQLVVDGDVDSLVVDRAVLVVGARVEERAADRMLAPNGCDRPAEVAIVVALSSCQFSGWIRRHS